MVIDTPITLHAQDFYPLAAHSWILGGKGHEPHVPSRGVVVINPATAVNASYYHRYARYLAEHGFVVLTYHYRGIGASRPGDLRQWKHITKTDWGRLDCEAALAWSLQHHADLPLYVVAHSIGGMVVDMAPSNSHVVRCLTVGAQYAYWPDYASASRLSMWLRWHVAMPTITALLGYFPAKKLGWHEDLPAGAAYEWAFRGKHIRATSGAQPLVPDSFQNMTADILAIGISDDPFGTPAAIDCLLAYFTASRRHRITVTPADVWQASIGHFAYFHEKCRDSLWRDSIRWLAEGRINPHSVQQESLCQSNI
jgi:predicted alpha/beta hydrolase